jgi:hypothetical protein
MESQKDWAKKVQHFRERLIQGFPSFKPELDARPDYLGKILGSMDLEFHWKRPHKGELSPEQQENVRNVLYPQVKLFFEQIQPIKKRLDKTGKTNKDFQNEARDFLKNNQKTYPYIKLCYLKDASLFDFGKAQPKRYFCRSLLVIMVYKLYRRNVTQNYIGRLLKKAT